MRRLVVLFVAVILAALWAPAIGGPALVGTLAAAGAQTDPATAEAQFVERINALRADRGLGRLVIHDELVAVGRGWAAEMAEADRISHNPGLAEAVDADWRKLGENVGVGTTVERLHAAFVASPSHHKNLVDPAFTHIGVGVVLGRDGAIFTAHQFMQLRTRAAAAAAAPTTTAPKPARAAPSARDGSGSTAGTTTVPAAPPEPREPQRPPARLVLVLEQLRALDAG